MNKKLITLFLSMICLTPTLFSAQKGTPKKMAVQSHVEWDKWLQVPETDEYVAYNFFNAGDIKYIHPDAPEKVLPKGLYFWKSKQQVVKTPKGERQAVYTAKSNRPYQPFVWSQHFQNYVFWNQKGGKNVATEFDASLQKHSDPSQKTSENRREIQKAQRAKSESHVPAVSSAKCLSFPTTAPFFSKQELELEKETEKSFKDTQSLQEGWTPAHQSLSILVTHWGMTSFDPHRLENRFNKIIDFAKQLRKKNLNLSITSPTTMYPNETLQQHAQKSMTTTNLNKDYPKAYQQIIDILDPTKE